MRFGCVKTGSNSQQPDRRRKRWIHEGHLPKAEDALRVFRWFRLSGCWELDGKGVGETVVSPYGKELKIGREAKMNSGLFSLSEPILRILIRLTGRCPERDGALPHLQWCAPSRCPIPSSLPLKQKSISNHSSHSYECEPWFYFLPPPTERLIIWRKEFWILTAEREYNLQRRKRIRSKNFTQWMG